MLQEAKTQITSYIPGMPKIQKNVSKSLGMKPSKKPKKFDIVPKKKKKKKTKPVFRVKKIRPFSAIIGKAVKSALIPKTPKV